MPTCCKENSSQEYAREVHEVKRIVLLIMAAGIIMTGCQQQKSEPVVKLDRTVATVNGEGIIEKDLQGLMDQTMGQHSKEGAKVESKEIRDRVLQQLIDEKLLLQGAKEAGVTPTKQDAQKELDKFKSNLGAENYAKYIKDAGVDEALHLQIIIKNLTLTRFVDSIVKDTDVSESEAQKLYEEATVPYMMPEQLNVRFIEIQDLNKANQLMQEIKQKGFDTVAKNYEKDPNIFASQYGLVSPAMFSDDINKALRDLKPGQEGGPFKGKGGYFLLRVKDRQPERPKTFEEAKAEIMAQLKQQKRTSSMAHWVAEKRNKSNIVIN